MTKILLLAFLTLSRAYACSENGDGFVPKNNLNIPASMKSLFGGISEESFSKIIDRAEGEYAPIFESQGLTLQTKRLWEDGMVNAMASFGSDRKERIVSMFGGLARHPLMTEDAFALVLCHEFGHHLGGAPRHKNSLLSAESQSDYFATAKCFRKIYLQDDNRSQVKISKVPPVARISCAKSFSNTDDQYLCLRAAIASIELSTFLAAIPSQTAIPKLETPDKLKVPSTNLSYPSDQCRLDTFFQGAICEKSHNEDFSGTDEVKGSCHSSTGEKTGLRPLCWYKPQT